MSSRKKFLLQSSALLGGGLLASAVDNQVFAIFNNRIMPSDQLNVGVIGVNGMGWSDASSAIKIPGVNLVAICDIDKSVIQNRLNELTKKNIDISRIKIYSDYRKLLEQKDIDIVESEKPSVTECLRNVGINLDANEVTVDNDEILSLLMIKYVDQEQYHNRR